MRFISSFSSAVRLSFSARSDSLSISFSVTSRFCSIPAFDSSKAAFERSTSSDSDFQLFASDSDAASG